MAAWGKKMPDRPLLVHEEEFTESFLKGSGPGGQKIVC
jgi:protein subunit release factor B